MLKEIFPYYLANKPVAANTDLAVTDKYSGEVATRVALADSETIDGPIAASVEATAPMHRMTLHELLTRCLDSPGVHLVEIPVDYSENDRILNHEIKELSSRI